MTVDLRKKQQAIIGWTLVVSALCLMVFQGYIFTSKKVTISDIQRFFNPEQKGSIEGGIQTSIKNQCLSTGSQMGFRKKRSQNEVTFWEEGSKESSKSQLIAASFLINLCGRHDVFSLKDFCMGVACSDNEKFTMRFTLSP